MKKFAKLFEIGGYQLLVYVEPDNDNEKDFYSTLHQMTDIGDAVIDIAFGGPDAAMAKVFDNYTEESAANYFRLPMVEKVIKTFVEEAA